MKNISEIKYNFISSYLNEAFSCLNYKNALAMRNKILWSRDYGVIRIQASIWFILCDWDSK
jgi:hypothetical protein